MKFGVLLCPCLRMFIIFAPWEGKLSKDRQGLPVRIKKVRKIIKHACISTEHDYIFLKKGTTLKDLSDNESLHSRTVRDVHIFTQPRSYLTNLLGNS